MAVCFGAVYYSECDVRGSGSMFEGWEWWDGEECGLVCCGLCIEDHDCGGYWPSIRIGQVYV